MRILARYRSVDICSLQSGRHIMAERPWVNHSDPSSRGWGNSPSPQMDGRGDRLYEDDDLGWNAIQRKPGWGLWPLHGADEAAVAPLTGAEDLSHTGQ